MERLVFSHEHRSRTRNRNLVIEISKAEKGTDYQIQNREIPSATENHLFLCNEPPFYSIKFGNTVCFSSKTALNFGNFGIFGKISEFRVDFRLKSGNIWIKWI